ncbi:hypothetical protein KII97_02555 [Leuconostoc gelidum subsp. gasicomitatum]|uniref:hypothetical protein n=1 Tax=Leuconostoc gasicomitatum TaxID=115778 RepID=UPI001CC58EE0|nr:hypothetical protein [Leuconostoc gasicomitatum]MBZ5995389.1 hypothetical protein [Leuconostoc gasicomitatum]
MEHTEDAITISKSELERLVAVEIAKQSLPRTRRDFASVAIRDQDILKINKQYPTVNEMLSHTYTSAHGIGIHPEELRGYGNHERSVFKRNRDVRGYSQWSHEKVYNRDIHEAIRKLSILTTGCTLIRELEPDELDFALGVYEDFKQLFLEKYNQRLSSEEERNRH